MPERRDGYPELGPTVGLIEQVHAHADLIHDFHGADATYGGEFPLKRGFLKRTEKPVMVRVGYTLGSDVESPSYQITFFQNGLRVPEPSDTLYIRDGTIQHKSGREQSPLDNERIGADVLTDEAALAYLRSVQNALKRRKDWPKDLVLPSTPGQKGSPTEETVELFMRFVELTATRRTRVTTWADGPAGYSLTTDDHGPGDHYASRLNRVQSVKMHSIVIPHETRWFFSKGKMPYSTQNFEDILTADPTVVPLNLLDKMRDKLRGLRDRVMTNPDYSRGAAQEGLGILQKERERLQTNRQQVELEELFALPSFVYKQDTDPSTGAEEVIVFEGEEPEVGGSVDRFNADQEDTRDDPPGPQNGKSK